MRAEGKPYTKYVFYAWPMKNITHPRCLVGFSNKPAKKYSRRIRGRGQKKEAIIETDSS